MRTTKDIIIEIDELLISTSLDATKKRTALVRLANEYWSLVFPEYGTPAFDQLSVDDQEYRWKQESSKGFLLYCTGSKRAVLTVLDSPASGDQLFWVR